MRKVKTISADILNTFPAVEVRAVDALLKEEVKKNRKKIVVLDDDPTGVQTVHDISVYTHWDKKSIEEGFRENNRLFYILTNSRGLTALQTEKVHREIAAVISQVSKETGKDFIMMSRSDSTLRGHYPLEPLLLKEVAEAEMGIKIDGEILCPFFKEGGRYTIDSIHYVKNQDLLVPVGKTEFAADKTFGYASSDLRDYVEEKTKGLYKAESVISIDLKDLRSLNFEKLEQQLMDVRDFNKLIVNAVDYVDIKIFCIALFRAMGRGKRYLFRTGAALVKEMGAVTDQPLLTRKQMIKRETGNGGVVIIGSHTQKTTRQLEELKRLEGVVCVEFNSDLVLNEKQLKEETERAGRQIEGIISEGKTAAAYTRRSVLTVEGETKEEALNRSVQISEAVQSLVGSLTVVPNFVIAKGGITSSDIGTRALRVRRANVMGQILPGIPVWLTGGESKFPDVPYVIFPGNVGEDGTLREAVKLLMKEGEGQ